MRMNRRIAVEYIKLRLPRVAKELDEHVRVNGIRRAMVGSMMVCILSDQVNKRAPWMSRHVFPDMDKADFEFTVTMNALAGAKNTDLIDMVRGFRSPQGARWWWNRWYVCRMWPTVTVNEFTLKMLEKTYANRE